MNNDLQTYIEPELEARLVALVLGEASAFEAEELERLMSERVELRLCKKRLEEVHGVLVSAHEAGDDEAWKLADERRGKIFAKVEEARLEREKMAREKRDRRVERMMRRRQLVLACAACVVVGLMVLVMMELGEVKDGRHDLALMTRSSEMSPEEALAALDEEIIAQSDLVQDYRKELTVVVQENGIPYFEDGHENLLGRTEQDMLVDAKKRLDDLEVQRDQLEGDIKGMVGEGASAAVKNSEVAKLELTNQMIGKLRDVVDKKKMDTIELSLKQSQYDQAKDAYEESNAMLRDMKAKQAGARAALQGQVSEKNGVIAGGFHRNIQTSDGDIASALAALDEAVPGSEPDELPLVYSAGVNLGIDDNPADTVTEGLSDSFASNGKNQNGRGNIAGISGGRSGLLRGVANRPDEGPKDVLVKTKSVENLGDGRRWAGEEDEQILEERGEPAPSKGRGEGELLAGMEKAEAEPSAPAEPRPLRMAKPAVVSKPTAPSASASRVIAAKTAAPAAVPVPQINVAGIDDGGKLRLADYFVSGNEGTQDPTLRREVLDGPRDAILSSGQSTPVDRSKFVDDRNGGVPDEAMREAKQVAVTEDQGSNDFLGGGTPGETSDRNNRDFINPVDRVEIPGIPSSPIQGVAGIVTGGNRSGSASINRDQIDGQLTNLREGGQKKNLSRFLHSAEGNKGIVNGQVAGDLLPAGESIAWDRVHGAPEIKKEVGVSRSWETLEQQEVMRRQQNALRSDEIRDEGVKAYADGDFETANRKYREALSNLPYGTATEDRREYLNKVLQDRSIALTQKYRRTGKYEEARELLEEVEANDPGNVEVAKTLEYLDEPIRTSPSLDYKHTKALDKVRRNLYKGEGYYDLGLYDEAHEEFKEVLRTDPYNKAARRWMERTAAIKSSYYRAAYDQTRAEMLMEVDRAWELAVPKEDVDGDGFSDQVDFLFGENADKELKTKVVQAGEVPLSGRRNDADEKEQKDHQKIELKKEAEKQKRLERDNFETSTTEKTDSTFSLNVSDVSFKLAKASLAGGQMPEVATVRAEEFVNALDYDDTRPTQAEKVACDFEQGAHPFLSQRNLMRISMSTASLGRNAGTPLRLTLLLDQSGSMERADRVESLQRAFALLAAQLNENDEVTLIGFARTPRLLAERVKGNQVSKLAEIIANPLTEGGTNLEEALASGLQLAKQQFVKEAQNRIILLTDGAANLGDARPERLAVRVESMRREGIAFDACGVGADGLNDEVMSSLAKMGDGRYYFLDRPEDADEGFARQIAGALRPAAKNVKVQVLFNPGRVATFKLYGFEKHQLKKEDFRNDAVDAAEMAAEESGVALYHFEPKPEGRGDVGTVSVRFLDTATSEMVERTWVIPYEREVAFFNEAEPKLRLAGVAGLFAEKLKGSPVGERVELKKLRQELQVLRAEFGSQARFQELQTMLQQVGD